MPPGRRVTDRGLVEGLAENMHGTARQFGREPLAPAFGPHRRRCDEDGVVRHEGRSQREVMMLSAAGDAFSPIV